MPFRGVRHAAALATILLVAAGCGTGQASGTPDTAPVGAPSELCPRANLRTPNGTPLHLTGRWLADDFGTFYLTQRGSCVHWLGMSPAEFGPPAGSWWTQVFVGQIASDFSIHGEWADVPYGDDEDESPNSGELILRVSFFDDDAGVEWPTLHLVEMRYGEGYGGQNWVPEKAMPPRAQYVGTYGYTNCPWLEVAGTRYELFEWQYDIADQGQLLGEGSQIVARPGDTLRVEGQVWPTTSPDSCLPDRMLAWDLEVSP